MNKSSVLNLQNHHKHSRSRITKCQNFSFSFSPHRLGNSKGLKIDCSSFKKNAIVNKKKEMQRKSPLSPKSPTSSKLSSLINSPKLKLHNLKNKKMNRRDINHDLSEKVTLKLIKPFIPQDRKIGLFNIRKTINHNFNINSKWTIIRDIEGYLLDSSNEFSLHYLSTVIDMDRFTPKDSMECRDLIKKAMEAGQWITLGFNHKICSIKSLIKHKITPENVMGLPSTDDVKYTNFRIIFVSRRLEYPRDMLESAVLVTIDEEILKKENELLRLNRVKWSNKPVTQIQKELDFVEACFSGRYEDCKQMLCKEGMSANAKDLNGNTALMEAALQGHSKICQLLLSHDREEIEINAVNKNNKTALHKAAFNGNSKIIELLLMNGCDPRLVDSNGLTAYNYIDSLESKIVMDKWKIEWTDKINKCKKDETEQLEELFLNTENLTLKLKSKLKEYLIEQAKSGDFQKIHAIVSIGRASIETRNIEGQSLLSISILNGKDECAIKIIEELTPNVNSVDHSGWTPLMNASANNQTKICKFLISNEADISIKNHDGQTAADIAKDPELKSYLKEEERKANMFSFEQMLEIELNTKNSPSFLEGTTEISNLNMSRDEIGNRGIFNRISKIKSKQNFYKNTQNKIKSKVDEINTSQYLIGTSSISKSSNSTFKSLSKNKKKVMIRKNSHFFNLRSSSKFKPKSKGSSNELHRYMSPAHFNSKKKLTDFLKVD